MAILPALGCPSAPALSSTTSIESPPGRHPDGVVLEPDPARPTPVERADARGVVALREPVAAPTVARFVETFLDAWRHESLDELASLLSKAADVGPIEARGRGREAVIEGWRQRLRSHPHEYSALEGDIVSIERIEHWDVAPVSAPQADPTGADVYVSAPLEVTPTGSERLFKSYLVMVLRREPGGFRMVAYGEDDQRPTP